MSNAILELCTVFSLNTPSVEDPFLGIHENKPNVVTPNTQNDS